MGEYNSHCSFLSNTLVGWLFYSVLAFLTLYLKKCVYYFGGHPGLHTLISIFGILLVILKVSRAVVLKQELFCFLGDIRQCGSIFGCHNWQLGRVYVQLASSVYRRPEMLLNILQCTGQLPPQQRTIQPKMRIVPRLRNYSRDLQICESWIFKKIDLINKI